MVYVIRDLGNDESGSVYLLYPPADVGLTALDVPACLLALASRARPVRDDEYRSERDALADLVEQLAGGGPLADQLRSRLSLVVDDPPGCWSFAFPDDES